MPTAAQIDEEINEVNTRAHKATQPQRKPFVLKDGETPLVLLDVECSNGWGVLAWAEMLQVLLQTEQKLRAVALYLERSPDGRIAHDKEHKDHPFCPMCPKYPHSLHPKDRALALANPTKENLRQHHKAHLQSALGDVLHLVVLCEQLKEELMRDKSDVYETLIEQLRRKLHQLESDRGLGLSAKNDFSDPKDDHDDCIRQIKRLTSDMTRQSAAFTRELDAMKETLRRTDAMHLEAKNRAAQSEMKAEKLSYDVESLKAHNQLLTYRLEALQSEVGTELDYKDELHKLRTQLDNAQHHVAELTSAVGTNRIQADNAKQSEAAALQEAHRLRLQLIHLQAARMDTSGLPSLAQEMEDLKAQLELALAQKEAAERKLLKEIDEGSMSRDELLLRLQSDNKELRKEKDKLRADVESFSKQNTELVRIKEELSSKLLHSEAVKHTAEQRYADAHRVREEMVAEWESKHKALQATLAVSSVRIEELERERRKNAADIASAEARDAQARAMDEKLRQEQAKVAKLERQLEELRETLSYRSRPLEARKMAGGQFKITTRTGDGLLAGTRAPIHVILVDKEGHQLERALTKATDFSHHFKRGGVDVFFIDAGDLGELDHVIVRNDGKGSNVMVKWHLVCMWVYDIQSKREYFCDCQKWLSREHGAGSMQVEIKVKLIKG